MNSHSIAVGAHSNTGGVNRGCTRHPPLAPTNVTPVQVALLVLAGTTTWLAVRGTIDIPAAIALIVVIVRYLEPFAALGDLVPATAPTRAALRDIRSVLDAPGSGSWEGVSRTEKEQPASVELRGVHYRYDAEGAPVFDGLDLVFEAGRTTAVVGPSGSGKSTLLNLIAGLEDAGGGSVLIGGVDRAALDPAERPADSSVVFQQPYLFAGTIRDNVLAGNPGADADQLDSVLRLARVEEFASRLSDGLETVVDEAGTALSGGERQRVSIARALLKPSSVLLVDEGTSALDAENEAAVVDAITDDPRRRTRIVVTHRLSTIAGADRVVFLENGRILEDGTVDELLAADGRFAAFWRHQNEAAGWRIAADAVAR